MPETFCPNSFSVSTFSDCGQGDNKSRKRAASPKGASQKFAKLEDAQSSGRKHSSEELESEATERHVGEEPTYTPKGGTSFKGVKLEDIYVLELFAGTARLTKSFKKHGFKAMAFDKTSKRSEGQSVLEFDLSKKDEVDSLLSFIKANADRIALIHMAPPCGTASRARGKRLHFLRALNIKEPRPLRDDQHPDGYPWLKGTDKMRTESANLIYESTVLIARTAISFHIAITLENPTNSLMWKTSPFQQLFVSVPQLKFVTFHNCAHWGQQRQIDKPRNQC